MTFFYPRNTEKSDFTGDVSKMDGTAAYLRHYGNLLFLKFMANNGTRIEKVDAAEELIICDRKLAYWQKHPRYRHDLAMAGVAEQKKNWRMPA